LSRARSQRRASRRSIESETTARLGASVRGTVVRFMSRLLAGKRRTLSREDARIEAIGVPTIRSHEFGWATSTETGHSPGCRRALRVRERSIRFGERPLREKKKPSPGNEGLNRANLASCYPTRHEPGNLPINLTSRAAGRQWDFEIPTNIFPSQSGIRLRL
jgi:hypothetical protein